MTNVEKHILSANFYILSHELLFLNRKDIFYSENCIAKSDNYGIFDNVPVFYGI